MSQLEEKSKFDRSGKARTNERKYPYIVELSVPPDGIGYPIEPPDYDVSQVAAYSGPIWTYCC
jgi:hypothetical protein